MTDERGKPLLSKLEPRKPLVSKTAILKSKSFKHEAKAWSKTGRNIIEEIWAFIIS
jgi:hypothetical protein